MPMMYIKSSIWSGFEIKKIIEDQFQSSPKLVGIWTVLRCIFVLNLEIITSIGGELWHAQAKNGVNFDFGAQFDLEDHNQSSHETIGLVTKVFYISGPNLVILALTVDELSRGLLYLWSKFGDPSLNGWWVIARTNSWLTDTRTHTRRQRQYPKAKTGLG